LCREIVAQNPPLKMHAGKIEKPAKGVEPLTPALRMRCSAD
jgi:hypothetical protein